MSEQRSVFQLSAVEQNIVRQIRLNGPATLNDLANLLGVSRSTVNKLRDELLTRGILQEAETDESSGGRRPRLLTLNPDFGYVVGINMGATGASICVANFMGKILETRRQELSIRDRPEDVLSAVFDEVFAILANQQLAHEAVLACGIGVPGPVDKDTGRIVSPAIMLGWDDYSLIDYSHRHFPGAVIKIENDASLMALGELHVGRGQGLDNFIFVKIGTGIGCGIIVNGTVYKGATGCSGNIGHVSIDRNGPVCYCGNVGCLETFAAGPAIAEQALKAAQNNQSPILTQLMKQRDGYLRPEDIGTAAAKGDKVANDIILRCGKTIGEILATLVSFFNPSAVIIGGGVSDIGPQFITSIHRTILALSLPLSTEDLNVHKSEIGYRAGTEGAVALALAHIFTTE